MAYFIIQWAVLIVGFAVYLLADRSPLRRTRRRVVQIGLLWVLVSNGAFLVIGGLAHIGPGSGVVAESIGYAPSMFQWEIGWADIALGVLGVACIVPRLRGGWLTAAVVGTSISLVGDGIGHVMQLVAHGNTAPNNVLAIPVCFLIPALLVVLLVQNRRESARARAAVPEQRAAEREGPRATQRRLGRRSARQQVR